MAEINIKKELLAYLQADDVRQGIIAAAVGDGNPKGGLKPAEALKLLDFIEEAGTEKSPAAQMPDESDMSQYTDLQLRQMLTELEDGAYG